jgi:hypothetical protein
VDCKVLSCKLIWFLLYICVFCGASVRVCKLIESLKLDLLQKARIQIWLFEQKDLRIEGRIIVSFLALFLIQTAKLSTSNSLLAPGNSLLAPVYANSCVVLGDKLS